MTKQQYKELTRATRLAERRANAPQWRVTRRLLNNLYQTVSRQTEPLKEAIREVDMMIASGINSLPSLYRQKPVSPFGKGVKPPLPTGCKMPANICSGHNYNL